MRTFYDQFLESERRWPNNIAVEMMRRDSVESYTYSELRRMAESIARWIQEQAYQKGDRLAILADNHPRWVAAYLGIMAAGTIAVPLDTAFHADQVAKLLKDSGSGALFVDEKYLEVAQKARSGLGVALVVISRSELPGPSRGVSPDADLDGILASRSDKLIPCPVESHDLATLLYTSGTTADPKGVMLTHANLMAEAEAVFSWVQIGPEDRILGILPLFHALAQMANLFLPLVRGSRVVYLETVNSSELLRALGTREITAFACVPQFFYLLHQRIKKEVAARGKLVEAATRALMKITRLSRALGLNLGKLFFRSIHHMFGPKMRYLVTGGSRWDAQIGSDFYSLGLDIFQAYGLTETTGGAFATPVQDNVIGSVGKPLKGVEAKIVGREPSAEGPPVGEIVIRGPIVMPGYWRRPEATAEVLREGWLHTGDLGYFDPQGNLFITGRQKDVIVLSSGKNIYPEEIEAHYSKSPFVKEICVLGLVSGAGQPFSERLHAVIVPCFDILKQRKIVNAKEVIRFDIENLSQQLPPAKRILSYEIWPDDLPRTTTRKLKRFEIEKRVRANQEGGGGMAPEASVTTEPSEEEASWLEKPTVKRALEIFRRAAKQAPSPLRPNHNLELDLGLDSLARIELLMTLERELGGHVPESEVSDIYTVFDLVEAIERSPTAEESESPRPSGAGWSSILREPVHDPEVLTIAQRRPFSTVFWFLVSRFAQCLARCFFRLGVTGLAKLPRKRPFILAPNHQSFLDPIVLASVLPWPVFHEVFAVGTSEIFGSGFMRTLARWLRVVVLDPDSNLIPAMRAGAFGLSHGRVLLLFPEGERAIDGKPKTFKKGAAILCAHLQVPIVPVALAGFYEVWPRSQKFPQKLNTLRIAFGDPVDPPPPSEQSEADYDRLTRQLHDRVLAMWMSLEREQNLNNQQAASAE